MTGKAQHVCVKSETLTLIASLNGKIMIKKFLLNCTALTCLLLCLFFADNVRSHKPLTLFGSEKFTILSLDPGASIELAWAYVLEPDISDATDRLRDIRFSEIVQYGTWELSDTGLKSSNTGGVLLYRYPILSREAYVFCFRVMGGNVIIEHALPGRRETITLSESGSESIPIFGLQEDDLRYYFPIYYLITSLLLTTILFYFSAKRRHSDDWKSWFLPEVKREGINTQFQLLKVVGIVLIVANHWKSSESLFYSFFPAYSFHVFLFVFVSGYFYREDCEQNIAKLILKKAKNLLLPLYLWNFTYGIITALLTKAGFRFGSTISFDSLFLYPIYYGAHFNLDAPAWFVMPLFMTEIWMPVFRKLISYISKGKKQDIICFILSLGLGVLGIYLANKGYNKNWSLAVTRLLSFIPFYYVGFFYKKYLEKRDSLPNFVYFTIIFGLDLIFICVNGKTLTFEPFVSDFKGFLFWPLILGFLGIAFWLRVTRILAPGLRNDRFINAVANSTFSIMMHHIIGFFLVNTVYAVGKLSSDTICQDFDLSLYRTAWIYTYIPGGIKQTQLIYTTVGIGIGMLIKLILDKISLRLFLRIPKKKRWTVYSALTMLLLLCAYGVSYL